jgi:hypothetical protein
MSNGNNDIAIKATQQPAEALGESTNLPSILECLKTMSQTLQSILSTDGTVPYPRATEVNYPEQGKYIEKNTRLSIPSRNSLPKYESKSGPKQRVFLKCLLCGPQMMDLARITITILEPVYAVHSYR